MNIFVLSTSPRLCAKYHCDKHLGKMILEAAQMLCTVNHKYGLKTPYLPTHHNHPCTLWAGRSLENNLWLRELARCLEDERQYRFGHKVTHRSLTVIESLAVPELPKLGRTRFARAMPEEYLRSSSVQSYRAYYHSKTFATWTRRSVPYWW